jgi:acyl-CoA synthetase (AMP-forming)/AMP-acid ligase II
MAPELRPSPSRARPDDHLYAAWPVRARGRGRPRGILVYGEAAEATPFASLWGPGGEPPQVTIEPAEDLVALPDSSGTTGLPKGVMLTHRNLVASICQTTGLFHTSARDRSIAVLPFFHTYGLVVIMTA